MSAHAAPAPAASPGGDELRRYVRLAYTLAVTDWKLRFFGSFLGYLWSLARPLMLFGVLYVVFSKVAKIGADVRHYPVYLLTGIVLFTFFAEAAGNAVQSLVERESLLRKIRFPRSVVPVSVALTALFNLGMNLLAVLAFMLLNGLRPRLSWLQLPVLVALLAILAVGLGLLLSALFVRFRDIAPIWEVVQQMLFYGSPIFYTVSQYGEFSEVMARTPLVAVLTQMRHALIDPAAPSAAAAAGGAAWLLVPVGICFGVLALGIAVFRRASARIAEDL